METQELNDNVYYIIFLGTSGSILLALSIIFFYARYHRRFRMQEAALQKAALEHKQQLINAVIVSQEEERLRISKDLHDHVGSSLSNLRLMASYIYTQPDAESAKAVTETYKKNIDTLIDDIRSISHSLSPAGLAMWGFHESLGEFCEKSAAGAGLGVQLHDYTGGALSALSFNHALSLFRVMQELLYNTIKHAGAGNVAITIYNDEEGHVCIKYIDDGKGIDATARDAKGIGMYNIQSRLSMIDADYELTSAVGKGYHFLIRIPRHHLQKQTSHE